jgi:hypothetical protein
MAPAAYVRSAAMDAAEHRAVPIPKMHQELLAELMARPAWPAAQEPT